MEGGFRNAGDDLRILAPPAVFNPLMDQRIHNLEHLSVRSPNPLRYQAT